METKEGVRFKVNGQCIKIYLGHAESADEVIEAYHLDDVLVIKSPTSCRDVKLRAGWEETLYVSSIKLKVSRDFLFMLAFLFAFISLNVTISFLFGRSVD